ncbi:MAG: alginate lyase family protein [Niastella sp.]|jgi:hypothetical protein|uniref:alginate lyase family protein n=1 Tax=Niastella sp. TaxID=1869183 RepID=UPI00389ADF90
MRKNGKTLYAGIALLALSTLLLKCKKQEESAQVQTPSAKEETTVNMAAAAITTFVHPGILNTQASLDQVAAEVNGGNDPVRLAAYNKVLDYINQNALPTKFFATVTVGSNGATTESKSQIRKDAILAYALALRWAKTGTITYAQQAIAILNGWSYTFKNYAVLSGSNPLQPSLEASWTTPSFVAAAEILRYYKAFGNASGWSDADINQFKTYIVLVKNNYINVTPEYNNNWNASAGYARMSIGIFLDDATAYQNGYNIIQSHLPIIIAPDGTIGEYCDRDDCVHYQYSLTAFAYAAELARIQGDNSLFTYNSNLLSKGYDYMQKAYNHQAGCDRCSSSSPVFPGTEVAYNYYKSANLKSLRELQDPLGWPNDRTFLGFTSYTHFNVAGL